MAENSEKKKGQQLVEWKDAQLAELKVKNLAGLMVERKD
jgi:hypothetical protein